VICCVFLGVVYYYQLAVICCDQSAYMTEAHVTLTSRSFVVTGLIHWIIFTMLACVPNLKSPSFVFTHSINIPGFLKQLFKMLHVFACALLAV